MSSRAVATRPISVSGRVGCNRRSRSPEPMARATRDTWSRGRRLRRTTRVTAPAARTRTPMDDRAMIHRTCTSVSSIPAADAVSVNVEPSLRVERSVTRSLSPVTSEATTLTSLEPVGCGVDRAPGPPPGPPGPPGGPSRNCSGLGPATTESPLAPSMRTASPWSDSRSARSESSTVPTRDAAAAARSRRRSSI